ncbi:hypothetical protein [Actibacterium sp. D379-3]
MRTPVYILYAEGHAFRGSVMMRCLQLSQIAEAHLSDRYEFRLRAMPRAKLQPHIEACADLKDGLVILSKSMVHNLERDAFDLLKAQNRAMLADWIDRGLRSRHLSGFDIHIAASMAFARDAAARRPDMRMRLLTHHADPRLGWFEFGDLERLSPVYLGHVGNIPDHPELADQITMAQVTENAGFAAFLPRLPEFNLHYNVRADTQEKDDNFKPFTKGFTAAACRSNILLQPDVHDAVEYLGADYPYFVADASLNSILDGLAFARESFGGPEWRYGLEVMRDVARRSSPTYVAGELGAILDEAMDIGRAPLRLHALG